MLKPSLSRRRVLRGLAAAPLALSVTSRPTLAAAPAPAKVTPELIEAARKEGKVAVVH